jgi:putative ATPase
VVPRRAQRLSALVDLTELGADLAARVQAAEEAMYHNADDPLVNWDLPELEAALQAAGFQVQDQDQLRYDTQEAERHITAAYLSRWFSVSAAAARPSYASRLRTHLSPEELPRVEACFRRQLLEQIVPWRTTLVYVAAS